MSGDITDFFVHTVTGYLDGKIDMVRNTDGEQVVSSSAFYCAVADAAKFTPDSKVTTSDGRTQQVISINTLDVAGTMPGVEHAVIYLK